MFSKCCGCDQLMGTELASILKIEEKKGEILKKEKRERGERGQNKRKRKSE